MEGSAERLGAAEPDGAGLEPDDIVALAVAAEKLQVEPDLVHRPEFGFFKELLLSWGSSLKWAAPPADGGVGGGEPPAPADVAPGGATVAAPAESGAPPAAAAVDVMELDSDEEELMQQREMGLPQGQLAEELADEEEKAQPDGGKPPEDPERLPKDQGPFPALPPDGNAEPSDALKKVLAKVKQQAGEALATGNIGKALDRYTEAIKTGGATALMLATRGALLLKQKRPCAAIRDCCAALQLNPDCGKAYHVRGIAHRKLGHWKKAHRDLSHGQRLDFSEDSVNVHMFVAKKVGVMQEQRTGRWYQAEGAKKAVELLFTDEGEEKKQRKGPSVDLRPGQAVRLTGLQKAPHLNGKRGIVRRLNPTDPNRWEVEVRLERGRIEVKSIKGENIVVVRAAEARAWKEEEGVHAEERRRRDRDEKRWQEDEEKRKRMEEKRKESERSLSAEGFPAMDPTERLEAEMSAMPLEEEAMRMLRRLKPDDALDVLAQVSLGGAGNASSFIKIKARQKLGDPDSDDDDGFARRMPPPAQPRSTAETPAARQAPPAHKAEKAAAPAAERRDQEEDMDIDSAEDSEDEDFDRLPEEQEVALDCGYVEPELMPEQSDFIARCKHDAADALDIGDTAMALQRYTAVISNGGATALMLTKRGELLLRLRRPRAAIQDCTAALAMNPDLGKAYRVRGIAHRKLGHWTEAHHDLAQGQRLDYEEGTSAVQKFVAEKIRMSEVKAARKRRREPGGGAPPQSGKRPRDVM